MCLIHAQELTKRFRHAVKGPGLAGAVKHLFVQKYSEKLAVDHIDLSIEAGEAVAYVGPNGAGKSTTIKMLTGILVPSSGRVLVDGIVPHQQRMRNAKQIGVVFGQRTQLWWDLPIRESLSLLKDIYEVPEPLYCERLGRLVELLDLDSVLHLTARKLSLGQRMRADLAAALLHEPKILYLDEPTIGLDVAVKSRIREFISELNRSRGTTIVLTTHDLEDIENLCRRLVIIDGGRIIYDGELQAAKDKFARERVMHVQLRERADELVQLLNGLPGVSVQPSEANELSVRFNRFETSARAVAWQVMQHAEVVDFRIDEPRIEDVIRQVYDGRLDLSAQEVGMSLP